jgi:hypothetical protein
VLFMAAQYVRDKMETSLSTVIDGMFVSFISFIVHLYLT